MGQVNHRHGYLRFLCVIINQPGSGRGGSFDSSGGSVRWLHLQKRQPANRHMSNIVVRKRDFKSVDLLGIVVGVYRKLN